LTRWVGGVDPVGAPAGADVYCKPCTAGCDNAPLTHVVEVEPTELWPVRFVHLSATRVSEAARREALVLLGWVSTRRAVGGRAGGSCRAGGLCRRLRCDCRRVRTYKWLQITVSSVIQVFKSLIFQRFFKRSGAPEGCS
jgi:hypothetical protein